MSGLGLNPIKLIVWITSLEWTQDMDWLLKLLFKAALCVFAGRGGGHRRPDLQAVPSHQGPGYGESEAGWL